MNMQVYKKEVALFQQQNGSHKGQDALPPMQPGEDAVPIGSCNVRFDKKVDELVYTKMQEYQTMSLPEENWYVVSVIHLKRGLIMASCSDNRLRVYVPGKAQQNNYLG